MPIKLDPEHCHEQADRLRERARITNDDKMRATLLRLANHYDQLAAEIERFQRGLVN